MRSDVELRTGLRKVLWDFYSVDPALYCEPYVILSSPRLVDAPMVNTLKLLLSLVEEGVACTAKIHEGPDSWSTYRLNEPAVECMPTTETRFAREDALLLETALVCRLATFGQTMHGYVSAGTLVNAVEPELGTQHGALLERYTAILAADVPGLIAPTLNKGMVASVRFRTRTLESHAYKLVDTTPRIRC